MRFETKTYAEQGEPEKSESRVERDSEKYISDPEESQKELSKEERVVGIEKILVGRRSSLEKISFFDNASGEFGKQCQEMKAALQRDIDNLEGQLKLLSGE